MLPLLPCYLLDRRRDDRGLVPISPVITLAQLETHFLYDHGSIELAHRARHPDGLALGCIRGRLAHHHHAFVQQYRRDLGLGQARRLGKGYERVPETAVATIHAAMSRIMLRRLARAA